MLLRPFAEMYRYPDGWRAPFFTKGAVQEEHFPWRYGVGTLIRLYPTRWAVTLGKYDGSLADEDEDGPLVSMRAMNWEEEVDAHLAEDEGRERSDHGS